MDLLEVCFQTTFGNKATIVSMSDIGISNFNVFLVLIFFLTRALCVVWTTPLVATLGMSLTIPLAMVADMVIHGRHYSAIYILGSAQVMILP